MNLPVDVPGKAEVPEMALDLYQQLVAAEVCNTARALAKYASDAWNSKAIQAQSGVGEGENGPHWIFLVQAYGQPPAVGKGRTIEEAAEAVRAAVDELSGRNGLIEYASWFAR